MLGELCFDPFAGDSKRLVGDFQMKGIFIYRVVSFDMADYDGQVECSFVFIASQFAIVFLQSCSGFLHEFLLVLDFRYWYGYLAL